MGLLQALGQGQPVSQTNNAFMQYEQFNQQSQLRGMQMQKEKLALEQAQKDAEYQNQEVDFRTSPFYLALPDAAKKQAEDTFKAHGAFDGNYRGTRRQMSMALEEIQKNKDAYKIMMQPVIEAKAEEVAKAFKALQKNPEDPELQAKYENSRVEHAQSSGELIKYLSTKDAAKDKFTAVNTDEGIVPFNTSTGTAGEPIGLAPDKADTIKNVTLDIPDPSGKKHPGGTMWTQGDDGKPQTYIGPAKDPTASARINIDMGKLSDKGLKTMVDNYMVDGKVPSFGFSAVGASQRRAFFDAVADRRAELGDTAGAQAARASGLQADTGSLKNAQKIYDMMDSYVRNMNAQVDRMNTILKDVTRLDARLANVPIRKWAMTVKGSAAESKVSMYTTEISNEIGKLSTGSAASVQELSQTAQQKWDKIHDPNLSAKDLISLLNETKHAGMLRMTTAKDVIDTIKGRIGGGGVPGGGGGKDPLGLGL